MFDFEAHDMTGLAEAVRDGVVAPEDLLEMALQRMTRVNPALNAVVTIADDADTGFIEAAPGHFLRVAAGVTAADIAA